MNRESMRSPLGRALGLGSAKDGIEHWWLERVTAIALVPLTLWFAASIVAHIGSDYVSLVAWLRTPIAAILMVLLLTALFYHTALGLQVVIEDYVHSKTKIAALMGMRFGCFALEHFQLNPDRVWRERATQPTDSEIAENALAVAGVLATLRIAFGG